MPRYPPDRWFDYSSFGLPIKGTRILPVKLPIPEEKSAYIPIQQRFTFNDLFSRVRSLGQTISCVIDLTYTNYYNPGVGYRSNFEFYFQFLYRKGVRYYKILVEGHNVPHQKHVDEFARIVGLERQRSPTKFSFFLVRRWHYCRPLHTRRQSNGLSDLQVSFVSVDNLHSSERYLIDVMGYDPSVALKEFEIARGHPIERENYIDVLLSMAPSKSSSRW
ncbi:hypothetical protein EG68_05538 [Paragonimus skrjabini miyazakii]|uniref:Uncharacterized protein n=1 Tax=Paragonimus skrjabini miyazakii TaxID=59628 RepID=A0A8S9YW76_9TREM|nr:hypothetical protein EG68_05538 [Paragonimus skrjabini miyazakii]